MRYVLSSLVMPCRAPLFCLLCREIGLKEFKDFLSQGFTSAAGHEATAKVLSELTGYNIPANRMFVDMQPGDEAVAVQFLVRLPEGRILNQTEVLQLLKEGKIVFRYIRRLTDEEIRRLLE